MRLKLTMNSRLVHFMLLGLVGFLVLAAAIGAKAIVGSLNSQANKLVSLKAKGQALNSEQTSLSSAKAEVKKYSSLEKIAESIVPQDKDQAEAVREIISIAQQNNINPTAIVFPTSSLGSSTPTPAVPSAGSGASSPSTSSVSLSQLTPVIGIPGVYTLPIQVQDQGLTNAVNYSSFFNFLSSLEQNRRTSLVTGISIQPDSNGLINFTLTISEYIKPQ